MNIEPFVLTRELFFSCLIMITTGSIGNLAIQFQQSFDFKHNFWICQQMFLGEIMALFSLIFPLMLNPRKKLAYFIQFKNEIFFQRHSKPPGTLLLGLGGTFDAFASCSELVAIVLMPSGYYALAKNGSIFFTALFTVLFLRRTLYRHHWLSILIIFASFILIAVSELLASGKGTRVLKFDSSTLIGVSLMVCSLIFSGARFVYQEFLLRRFALDPRRLVGNEGLFGALMMTVALTITAVVPCRQLKVCDLDQPFDSPGQAIGKMLADSRIMAAGLAAAVFLMAFNVAGSCLTKKSSGLFRTMVDSLRTFLIYVASWILGLTSTSLLNAALQLTGFCLMIFGNLVFVEMVQIKFLGLNKYVINKK